MRKAGGGVHLPFLEILKIRKGGFHNEKETFNAIINYLVNQPYNQVSGLIEMITKDIQEQQNTSTASNVAVEE